MNQITFCVANIMLSFKYYTFFTILVVKLEGYVAREGADYCNAKMCPFQGKHVACGTSKVS